MNATTQAVDSIAGLNERIDRLERKGQLSALWLFVLLNLVFRDLHEIVKAEFLEDALTGTYNGQEVTEALFLVGGIIIEIPIMMMLMALVLPQSANRRVHLVIAPLFGLLVILTDRNDLDDYFHSGLELIALAAIIWCAWRWNRSHSGTPADHA